MFNNSLRLSFRFRGKICDEEIFECDAKPCLNGGICINREKTNNSTLDELKATNGSIVESIELEPYTCNCNGTGFKGTNCEINIDDCVR